MAGLRPIKLGYWRALAKASTRLSGENLAATVWCSGSPELVARKLSGRVNPLDIREGLVTLDREKHGTKSPAFEVRDHRGRLLVLESETRARRFTSGEVLIRDYERVHPASTVEAHLENKPLDLVVFDPRGGQHTAYTHVRWSDPAIGSAAFVCRDVDPDVLDELHEHMRAGGLILSGHLWGSAEATRFYSRPESWRSRITTRARRAWVHGGGAPASVRAAVRPVQRERASLESRASRWPGPVPAFKVEELLLQAQELDGSWDLEEVPQEPIRELASQAMARFGVYPLSFSHPNPRPLALELRGHVSPIVPGFPYTFTDEHAYMETYSSFTLGLTHRKAGWDCFRHVEILAAGAVPLMMDVDAIPRYSMVHYPKRALRHVLAQVRHSGTAPGWLTRLAFRDYMNRHLTSAAMARYILELAHLPDNAPVTFLDDNLVTNPEYQSTLTAIGLKQILGPRCILEPHPPLLYSDSRWSAAHLYGRGFGYTRVLDPALKSESETHPVPFVKTGDRRWEGTVVIGSVSRNRELAHHVLAQCNLEQIIMIHGEDVPPSAEDLRLLRHPRVTGFVRAIHR